MKLNVAFFGDSICFGQGISIHKGWVPRISQNLESLGLGNKVEISVLNSSVNGNTTRMALERMPYDIQSHPIDIMIVQFGMNDCNYWKTDNGVPRVSPKAFEANLHEIIDRAYLMKTKKVFLNTNHPTTRNQIMPPSNITYQESNAKYSNIIRNVAATRNDVNLIDIENEINNLLLAKNIDLSELLLDDQLHLSVKGHDVYFNFVYPTLEAELKKLFSDV